MPQRPEFPTHTKRFSAPILLLSIVLAGLLLGVSTWSIYSYILHATSSTLPVKNTPSSTTQPSINGTPASKAVSPLIFGTNLGLFNSHDQFLTSATTLTHLQQLHPQIIRMPVRTTLSESVEIQTAQTIKNLGAIPLVVLHGTVVQTAVADDTRIINDMNQIFGHNVVYYEYGNEEDLLGVPATTYTSSWNTAIPQLKRAALNGQFIGPVNYHYDRNYLTFFLQHAQPRPDQISWHEYTCDDSWTTDICIANIANWTTHIANARAIMQATIGTTLDIMITEWNYAPNAVLNDGKNNNSAFMAAWTTSALQTLAANRVFASMQYSCTNTAIPLISSSDTMTTQGTVFQTQYQQMIVLGRQPPPVHISIIAQPTSPANSTAIVNGGTPMFSFEDGGTDGWHGHGQGIVNIQNSTNVALDGKHALQVTLSNTSSNDFPYVSISESDLISSPQAGQTITAYVYLSTNSVSLSAKLFVMANDFQWYAGQVAPLVPGTWTPLTYILPSTMDGSPQQMGIQFNSTTGSSISSIVYIDAITW